MNANWAYLGLTLWIQSFLVLAVGFVASRVLQRRGPAAQRFALRAALCGVVLCAAGQMLGQRNALWNVSLPATTQSGFPFHQSSRKLRRLRCKNVRLQMT
jgi:hypothetical protein